MKNYEPGPLPAKKSVSFFLSHRSALAAAAGIMGFYGLLFLFGITCPIKYLSGVSCPGCGMTRAWVHVVLGDLAGAWRFHPLFWLLPPLFPVYFLRKKHPLFFKGILIVAVGLFLVVYLFRMLEPLCDVVVFEPKNSVFYRLFSWLRALAGPSGAGL